MNDKAIVKNYDSLTPEERFRLILAAGGRRDEAERDRLCNASKRITLSMLDYSPYASAFNELALVFFMELLEEAARYLDAFGRVDDAQELSGDPVEEDDGEAEADSNEQVEAEPAEEDTAERPLWQRHLDLAMASGYVLRTKVDGWKLFCERLNVPPFLLWEKLAGYDRLQRALALAEKAAFVAEGFLRWMNTVRPAGQPELTTLALTLERIADETAEMFRQGVEQWGG
jgi:hypothetical protein